MTEESLPALEPPQNDHEQVIVEPMLDFVVVYVVLVKTTRAIRI